MKKHGTYWDEKELALLGTKESDAEIARFLGRTLCAVQWRRKQWRAEKKAGIASPVAGPSRAPEVLEPREAHWKQEAKKLSKELSTYVEQKTAVEVLCEQVMSLAPRAYSPAKPVEFNLPKKHVTTKQSAVLLLSDTHIGQIIKPEQTLGLGGYNFELFLRRLQRLEDSIRSIITYHTPSGVDEIVVSMLGDMLDGALQHSAEMGQANTLLEQFYSGGHAIAQFLRNLSSLAPLRLYGVVGNHPRWQNQKRMPSQQRNSNYDMFLYCYLQALLRDNDRIKWNLDWQPFSTFAVRGYEFYCGHGENLRGGDKTLGIPNHAIGRLVGSTTQLFSRAGRPLPAYYCVGHLHRPISLPHANGEVIVNGAFPGIDGYALNEYFNSSRPLQRFFFVHPKFGKSAEYALRLDLGDAVPHRYQLPDKFAAV